MIWAILIIGFLLRLISLDQSLWLDEAINVLATQKFSLLEMITEYAKADFHPPGYFIILWIWTKLFGIGETVVRIPSVIFGTITIYLIYLLGCKIHSKTLGLVSALLLAINPLHIYYSQEARMYALATLAVSINILLLIKLIKGERLNTFFLIISNLFVLSFDYVTYFIFPAQLIFLIIYKQEIIKKWLISLSLAILLGIWWLPTFFSQLDVGAVTSEKLPAWKLIVGGFDYKALPLTFIKFIIGRISHPDKLIYVSILMPIIILFSFLLPRGIKFIKGSGRYLLLSWIAIPLILATLISFIIPIYSYFRMLFVLPAFIILVALGVLSFESKLRYILLIAVLLVQIFSASVYLFNKSYQREDWKGLVNFLKFQKNYLVIFESSGTLPPFDYYADNSLNARGALKDFPVKDESSVIDLQDLPSIQSIYLVDYLVEISDPNRLVAKKLNQSGYKIVDTKDFPGVGFVYHYVK